MLCDFRVERYMYMVHCTYSYAHGPLYLAIYAHGMATEKTFAGGIDNIHSDWERGAFQC